MSQKVHLVCSQAEIPHSRPRRRHGFHDEEREKAVRGGARQRVQHLLGPLHLVHIQGPRSSEEGETVEPVCSRKHHAGLKLFVSEKGSEVRKNLLLSLIKDDRLELKDAEKLLFLLRDTFSPLKLAKSAVQNIISPA